MIRLEGVRGGERDRWWWERGGGREEVRLGVLFLVLQKKKKNHIHFVICTNTTNWAESVKVRAIQSRLVNVHVCNKTTVNSLF